MHSKAVLTYASLFLFLSIGIFGCSSGSGDIPSAEPGGEPEPIPEGPVDFSAEPISGDAPLEVQFVDESDVGGEVTGLLWVFGDGATSTEQSPAHIYDFPGTYTVGLIVTTSAGSNSKSELNFIEVLPSGLAPETEFSASPTTGEVPFSVQFNDESILHSAGPVKYLWDFGDGTIDPEKNPSHIYVTPGVYAVSLAVTTAGGTTTIIKEGFVVALAPILPPEADFRATPRTGEVPLDVQFLNLSELQGAETVDYFWFFGDGATSTEPEPLHTYVAPGRYTVTLIVTTRGGTDIESKFELIQAITAEPPVADFSGAPTSGEAPLAVEFTNLSDLRGAESATYSWNFGDGGLSTLEHPSHTYTVTGVYDVTLTVTTVAGSDTLTREAFIAVLSPEVVPDRAYVLLFPESSDFDPPVGELSLIITSEVTTGGVVTVPGLGFAETFVVVPGTATVVTVPRAAVIIGSDVITNQGVQVSANDPISVYGINHRENSTDGYVGFPIAALGTEHFVMSSIASSSFINFGSEFAIVASEDTTTITITPTTTTGGRSAGIPYEIFLNRLQTYQLQSDDFLEDLTGTHISSDKPIAVFGGHVCAFIPDNNFFPCDHVVEQLPPLNTWGTEVILVSSKGRFEGDTYRVLAAQDDTTVNISLDGATFDTFTLDSGQFLQDNGPAPPFALRFTADKPILVAQFANSASFDPEDNRNGDPFMLIVMPEERFLASYTFATPTGDITDNFVNLVAPSADVDGGLILLDDVPVDAGLFETVPGTGLSTASVSIAPGTHTITGPNPIGLYIYGFVLSDSYGFPGGMAF